MVFKLKKLIPPAVVLLVVAGVIYFWGRRPAPPEPIVYPESTNRELVKNFTSSLMVAPDGKRMVTAAYNSSVRVWDCETGTLIYTVPRDEEFTGVGRMVLSNSGVTLARAVISAAWMKEMEARGGTPRGMRGFRRGSNQTQPSQTQAGQTQPSQTQASRGAPAREPSIPPRGGIQLVGLQPGRSPEFLASPAGMSPYISTVAFSHSDRYIAGGIRERGRDGYVIAIWERGQPTPKIVLPDALPSFAFAPDDESLATVGTQDYSVIRIVDRDTGKLLKTLGEPASADHKRDSVNRLVYSSDGALLACSFTVRTGDEKAGFKESQSIRVWDVAGGTLKWSRPSEDGGWRATLFFSPDGRTLVSTQESETLLLDAASGRLKQRIPKIGGAAAFVDDGGTVLAAIGEDKAVKFVDTATGRVRASLMAWTPRNAQPGSDAMLWVTYTADGHYVATPGADGLLRWYTLADVNDIPADVKGIRDPARVREALGQASP
ncbi:MAG: hypothetical protein K8S99_16735 [Planctomycetes bacterium]|nr:hypothetical protein [Planctomycetota bacterium]